MELGVLKSQVDLSNKKWDKALKGLAAHGLTKVEKTEGRPIYSNHFLKE